MTITDIVNSIYMRTKTNSSSFPAADMLIGINNAYNRVISLIEQADGRWQYDDNNNTDLPIATGDLVNGQQDYSLSTTHLQIIGVSVKDSGGLWHGLIPIDTEDITHAYGHISGDRAEYRKTNGLPLEYDKLGNSVFLYPAPDNGVSVTLTGGLKIYFKRGPAEFTSAEVSTGTKVPGFNSLYHDLIPLWVSYNYWLSNKPQLSSGYLQEIARLEQALKEDYGKRDKDDKQTMTMKQSNYI